MNRGREIMRGKLWLRKAKSAKGQPAEVVVYCAVADGSQAGQIQLFEVSKNYQKPINVISLAEVTPPGIKQGTPCVSLSRSPGSGSPLRNSSYLVTSPSNSMSDQMLYPFQMVLRNGEVIEFFAETAEDQRQWMECLGLLLMFPYSPIPEEPSVNPIKDSMKTKLNSKDYNGDSVWGVYILPEEVGSRLLVLGFHVVAIRSTQKGVHPGQLDIINWAALEPGSPIVTWDRDKMRRTGCLGNMVFIEIGRRCRGGPGLIWMYAGQKEVGALRETLQTFLFKGDGHAVPITTYTQEPTVASFDSTVHSSYRRGSSSSSITRSQSHSTSTCNPSARAEEHIRMINPRSQLGKDDCVTP